MRKFEFDNGNLAYRPRGRAMLLAAVAFAGLYVPQSFAQVAPVSSDAKDTQASTSVPSAPTDAQDNDNSRDIVVTASKYGQINKAAFSAVEVDTKKLEDLRVQSVGDVAAVVPSLVYTTKAGKGEAYIRGIGVNAASVGVESPVATIVDGVYLEHQFGSALDLVDLENVTILNGPQGTLYGRNATGGVIMVKTADPKNEFGGSVFTDVGNIGRYTVSGVLNVPVADTIAVRVSGKFDGNGGYVRSLVNGSMVGKYHGSYVRAKVRWSPTSNFDAVYSFEFYGNHDERSQQAEFLPAPFCSTCVALPSAPTAVGQPLRVSTQTPGYYNDVRYFGNTLNLTYRGKNYSIVSVSGVRTLKTPAINDLDGLGPSFFYGRLADFGTTITNDTYIKSDFAGPLNGLFGGSFLHDNAGTDFPFGGALVGPIEGRNQNHIKIVSYSAYGELTYATESGFKLTAGGRYNYDRKVNTVDNDALAVKLFVGGNPAAAHFTLRKSWQSFTPRVVLAYDKPGTYLYISYNRGVKSGAFPAPLFSPTSIPADQEILDSFEIGAKNSWFNGKLHTTLDVFYGKYTNIQVQTTDIAHAAVLIQNAADAKLKGVEFNGTYDPTSQISFGFGATFMDNKFGSFPNATVIGFPGTAGCLGHVGDVGLARCAEDLSGTQLARSPKFSGYFSASIKQDLGNDYVAHLYGIVNHTSKYYFAAGAGGPLHTDVQRPLTKANASLTVTLPGGKTDVGVYVNNLFDVDYVTFKSVGTTESYYYAPFPRTYGLTISQKF